MEKVKTMEARDVEREKQRRQREVERSERERDRSSKRHKSSIKTIEQLGKSLIGFKVDI